MPVTQKKSTADTNVAKTTVPAAKRRERATRRTAYLITALVVAVVIIIVGVVYYQAVVAPFQRVIITVDDTQLRADYFLERARLAGADPMSMTLPLTNDILIRKGAPQFGISVTQQEIDDELRRAAAGDGEPLSDAEFKEWYRQQIAQARVSEATYREVIETAMLAQRMQAYLGERIETSVPQIHVSAIFVQTEDEANKVIERFNAGENFADLARELSMDEMTGEAGGDFGWMPRGVAVFDTVAFDMEVGKISEPFPYMGEDPNSPPAFFYVLLVTEKSDARQVDERYLEILKGQALQNWLNEEVGRHKVSWDFNSDLYIWLKHQLAKTQPSDSQSSNSQPPDSKPSGGGQ